MTIVRTSHGDIIHRSCNLRGMIEHARRAVPVRADFERYKSACPFQPHVLRVTFDNGDVATSAYADPIVAARFLNSRRSWGRLQVDGPPEFLDEYASERRL